MYFTGFADEAGGGDLDKQIQATKGLGWKNIEPRVLYDGNLASITDAQFDEVCEKLDAAGVKFNCYGSGIANWAKKINEPPGSSYEEFSKAIPRMHKLGIKMVRVMSFAVPVEIQEQPELFDEAVKRMKVIAKMGEDSGILCVHENCSGWGGLSYEHTLRLLEAVDSPSLKLVFDTGNPPNHDDVRGEKPYLRQSSWEFYNNVKEHIAYIHIKDAYLDEDGNSVFCFPGYGHGDVWRILQDLFANGYDGGLSIEPHMKAVIHQHTRDTKEEDCYRVYIEYGQKLMKIVDNIKGILAG